MVNSKQVIISNIINYINSWDSNYSNWYIGIASDPNNRLFNDHGVVKEQDAWIFRECENSIIAREIEEYFINLGIDGGSGGGDINSSFVYVYKKSSHTKED